MTQYFEGLKDKKRVDRIDQQLKAQTDISFSRDKLFITQYIKENAPDFFNRDKLSILDIGCGNAYYTVKFSELFPNASVLAIDNNKALVEKAEDYTLGTNIKVKWVDFLDTLDFEDRRFDIITMRAVCTHQYPEKLRTFFNRIESLSHKGTILFSFEPEYKFFINYPASDFLNKIEDGFQKLNDIIQIDINMGRKMPFLFTNVGFGKLKYEINFNDIVTIGPDDFFQFLLVISKTLFSISPDIFKNYDLEKGSEEFRQWCDQKGSFGTIPIFCLAGKLN